MHLGRRSHALQALLVAGLLLGLATACAKEAGPTVGADGRVSVYVAAKIMPKGMLVATAKTSNVIELRDLPADVAGSDAVFDTNGLDCLVAAQSLPQGTVVRRNQLVPPASIGLDQGLTGDTGPRPSGC